MTQKQDHIDGLITHFFRHSHARMVATLIHYFGLPNMELAEDIVQDALVQAVERWSIGEIPAKPVAWLMEVAKRIAVDKIRRDQILQQKVQPQLKALTQTNFELDIDTPVIEDSTLRMIFTVCHPALPRSSQVALALKSLCGLSIPEIADALLADKAAINKKLYRAKLKFRSGEVGFGIPAKEDLVQRLDTVYTVLYLLFGQGYYSTHHDSLIRTDLCYEAIRLQQMVVDAFPDEAQAKALLSLMLLTFARFKSRQDKDGNLVIFTDQDRSLWDKELIARGIHLLHTQTRTSSFNKYQLQAGIAAEHCMAQSFQKTDWESIYQQYSLLATIDPGPVVQFNMAIARFYFGQKQEAIDMLLKMDHIKDKTLLYATIGTLYKALNDQQKSIFYLDMAIRSTNNEQEKRLIRLRSSI